MRPLCFAGKPPAFSGWLLLGSPALVFSTANLTAPNERLEERGSERGALGKPCEGSVSVSDGGHEGKGRLTRRGTAGVIALHALLHSRHSAAVCVGLLFLL